MNFPQFSISFLSLSLILLSSLSFSGKRVQEIILNNAESNYFLRKWSTVVYVINDGFWLTYNKCNLPLLVIKKS